MYSHLFESDLDTSLPNLLHRVSQETSSASEGETKPIFGLKIVARSQSVCWIIDIKLIWENESVSVEWSKSCKELKELSVHMYMIDHNTQSWREHIWDLFQWETER